MSSEEDRESDPDALGSIVPGACAAPLPAKLVTTIWKAGHPSFAGGSEKFSEPTKPVDAWPQTWSGLVRRIERGQKLPLRDDKRMHPHLGLYHSPQGFRSNREGDVVVRTGIHVDIDEGATEETATELIETLERWGLAAVVQRRDVLEPHERKLRAIVPLMPDDGRETFYSRAAAFLIGLSETIGCPIDLAPGVWSQPTFIYGPVTGRAKPTVVAVLEGGALDLSDVEGTAWGRRVGGESCPDAVKLCRAMFAAAGCSFDDDRCTRPPDGDNPSSIEFMPDGGFRCWTQPTYQVRAWLKLNVREEFDRWWQHPGRRVERARSTLRTREARVEGKRGELDDLSPLLGKALTQGGQHVFELPRGIDGAFETRAAMRALAEEKADAGLHVVAVAETDDAEGWHPVPGEMLETSHGVAFAHRDQIERLAILGAPNAVESLVLTQEALETMRRSARDGRAIQAAKRRRVRNAFEYIVEDLFFAGYLHTIPEWTLPDSPQAPLEETLTELSTPPEPDGDMPEHLQEVVDAALRQPAADDFDSIDAERIVRRLLELGGTRETQHDDDLLRVACIPAWTQQSFVLLSETPDPALEQVCPEARWIRFEGADQCEVERVWHVTAPLRTVSDDADALDDPLAALRALWDQSVAPLIADAEHPLVCVRDEDAESRVLDLGFEGRTICAGDDVDTSLEDHDLLVVLGAPLPPDWHPEASNMDAPRDPSFWRTMERQVEGALRGLERRLRLRSPQRDPGAPRCVRLWYFGPSFPSPPWRESECRIVAS